MTYEQLVALINTYGGEDAVLAIGFDNSTSSTYGPEDHFSFATSLDQVNECVVYVAFDMRGNPYHVVKPIASIQNVVFKDANYPFSVYDRINLRG